MTEREFAALLGISQGAWNQIRQRISRPGLKVLAGVTRKYADLRPDVMLFLEEEPGLMELWSEPIPA
jgi:transcriptional regulator with XRE-family HTH domain